MPRVDDASQRGALGVTITQLAVEGELGWIFRRGAERDTGIDAQVEVVLFGEATGLTLAVQIKAGASYFKSPMRNGWAYRPKPGHLKYWRAHSLPVIVVLVDLEKRVAYWGAVPEEGPTVEISSASTVSRAEAAMPWLEMAWGRAPSERLFRYCLAQERYFRTLRQGGRVLVEVDEWVNKTRGQAEVKIVQQDRHGKETAEELFVFAGAHHMPDFIGRLFPWAQLSVDDDYYGAHEEVDPKAVFQDDESPGGHYVIPGDRPTGLRPYAITGGEVASWRLELTLNRIGKAFVTIVRASREATAAPPFAVEAQLRE